MVAAAAGAKRKRDLSEDEVYLILHKSVLLLDLRATRRFSPARPRVLVRRSILLQEVAQHTERRSINWRALVAKTATGITSAREYQMLWRYIAYGHDFVENVEDGSPQPLGDESDLECEIEPSPKPSNEAAAEASRFAKVSLHGSGATQLVADRHSWCFDHNQTARMLPGVLLQRELNVVILHQMTKTTLFCIRWKTLRILMYGPSREQGSSHRANSDVPLLNTPNEKIPRVSSDKQLAQSHRLTNGTGPVSNSKQAPHTGLSPDSFDGNGPHNKKTKKTKAWTKDEDAELMAGVHKCGEGNWLDILRKYNFDSTRTYGQLSQRWAVISRRQATTKPAKAKPVTGGYDMKATQKAFFMALDMPMGKPGGLSTLRSGASQQSTQHPAPVFGAAAPELKSATPSSSFSLPVPVPSAAPGPVSAQVQVQPPRAQQVPSQAAPSKVSNASIKSRNSSKKQTAQANPTNAPSSIQAAAIAAGGRIATASIATNLLKAAQSPQAVHIRSRGKGSSKTSTSSKASTMAGEPGTQTGGAQHPELPNCSAPTQSPTVLITQSTEQVNVVPEVAGVNPPEQSASAHLLEPDRTLSTTPVPGPCDNMEIDDDSTFCVVTMEDLFPEDVKQPETVKQPEMVRQPETVRQPEMVRQTETVSQPEMVRQTETVRQPEMVKQPETVRQPEMVDPKAEEMIDPKDADMLEFDRFVAQGCLTTDYSDKSKGVKIAPGAQGATASQKKKQLPTVGKSIPVFRAPVTMKKTKALPSHGATLASTVASSGLVGTGNAGVLSKAIYRKPAGPGTTGKQNSGTPARNTAPGTGTPPVRNTAPGTGTPPVRNTAPGTGTPPVRNTAPGTGTPPVRNMAPGTGTPAVRNTAPGTGTAARNSLTGTGTPQARNLLTGTGTPPARNAAPVTGATPARNLLTGMGTPPAIRQHNPAPGRDHQVRCRATCSESVDSLSPLRVPFNLVWSWLACLWTVAAGMGSAVGRVAPLEDMDGGLRLPPALRTGYYKPRPVTTERFRTIQASKITTPARKTTPTFHISHTPKAIIQRR
ncbi:Telomeric repeat-binding factor 1 [Triticum urartu]|uniref:Telomeric repeat-binding factor 1 n=1 Tax=Triticum urartu TaxID=4572 RepID=M7ZCA4_TRIUA|nr:Telomeric repeat-binding factor 1 [Triticum urartu]